MTLALAWFVPDAPLRLQWLVGAADATFAAPAATAEAVTALAVVLGPPGQNAGDTLDGDRGDVRIQGGQWLLDDIDCGTFN
jgi:hypothetical protein